MSNVLEDVEKLEEMKLYLCGEFGAAKKAGYVQDAAAAATAFSAVTKDLHEITGAKEYKKEAARNAVSKVNL